MNNRGNSAGAAAAIFEDCFFMASEFSFTSFEHCNREANKVAHELARLAKSFDMSEWIEEPLENIVHLLIDDVTLISN
ncbi:hypothetical protein ZWY2020_036177 [Hordeum vulgare]|nr:hypothetical protein ZWY2020_036177 [Hordeum vulgare]